MSRAKNKAAAAASPSPAETTHPDASPPPKPRGPSPFVIAHIRAQRAFYAEQMRNGPGAQGWLHNETKKDEAEAIAEFYDHLAAEFSL